MLGHERSNFHNLVDSSVSRNVCKGFHTSQCDVGLCYTVSGKIFLKFLVNHKVEH